MNTRPRMEWLPYSKAAELCQVTLSEFVAWARRRARVGKAHIAEEFGIPRREWEIQVDSLPREAYGRICRWWLAQDAASALLLTGGIRIPSYRFDVDPAVYGESWEASDVPKQPVQLSLLDEDPVKFYRKPRRMKGTLCPYNADAPAPPMQLMLLPLLSEPDSQAVV